MYMWLMGGVFNILRNFYDYGCNIVVAKGVNFTSSVERNDTPT